MTNLYVSGSIATNGNEQTLIIGSYRLASLSGYVSLSGMQNGDIMSLREYGEIDGAYESCYNATYTDAQNDSLIYVTPKQIITSLKVTLQQITGSTRTVKYSFLIEGLGQNGVVSYGKGGGITL